MMPLFTISEQLSLESLLPALSTTPSMLEQLPVYFYLITRRIPLDCFDKSIYSQCIISN